MGERGIAARPMPSTARPFETRLTLVIAVAVAAAWRVTELVTPVPRPIRVVAVAAKRERDIGIAGEILRIDHQHAVPTGGLDLLRGAGAAARRSDAGGPQLHVLSSAQSCCMSSTIARFAAARRVLNVNSLT